MNLQNVITMDKLMMEEKLYVRGLIREIRELRLRFTLKFDEHDKDFRDEDVKALAVLYKELHNAIDHFPELTLEDIQNEYLKLIASSKQKRVVKSRKFDSLNNQNEKTKKSNFINSMYRCVKTPERKLCPLYLVVSSTGPGLLAHPDCMGLYKLSDLQVSNYPIYEMCEPRINQSYIFLSAGGRWVVGREGKPGLGVIVSGQPPRQSPPIFGWRYAQNNLWKQDMTIAVKPLDDEKQVENGYEYENILKPLDDEKDVENGNTVKPLDDEKLFEDSYAYENPVNPLDTEKQVENGCAYENTVKPLDAKKQFEDGCAYENTMKPLAEKQFEERYAYENPVKPLDDEKQVENGCAYENTVKPLDDEKHVGNGCAYANTVKPLNEKQFEDRYAYENTVKPLAEKQFEDKYAYENPVKPLDDEKQVENGCAYENTVKPLDEKHIGDGCAYANTVKPLNEIQFEHRYAYENPVKPLDDEKQVKNGCAYENTVKPLDDEKHVGDGCAYANAVKPLDEKQFEDRYAYENSVKPLDDEKQVENGCGYEKAVKPLHGEKQVKNEYAYENTLKFQHDKEHVENRCSYENTTSGGISVSTFLNNKILSHNQIKDKTDQIDFNDTACELNNNSNKISSSSETEKQRRFGSKIPMAKNSNIKWKFSKFPGTEFVQLTLPQGKILSRKCEAMKPAQNVIDDDFNNNSTFTSDTNLDEEELESDLEKDLKTAQDQQDPDKVDLGNQIKNTPKTLANINVKSFNYHPFIPYASKKLGEVLYEKTRLHLQNVEAFDKRVVEKNEFLKKLWDDWEMKSSKQEKDQEKEKNLVSLRQKAEIQKLQVKHIEEINELSNKFYRENALIEANYKSEIQKVENDLRSSKKDLTKEKGKFQRHRHDSIIKFIAFHIDDKKYEVYADIPGYHIQDQGLDISKTIPRRFLMTKDNPDIVIIDEFRKMLNIFEVTVTREQNIKDQHLKKIIKYDHLWKEIVNFGSGFSPEIVAFEIGARGLLTEANKRRLEKLHKFLKGIHFGELCKNMKMLASGGSTTC